MGPISSGKAHFMVGQPKQPSYMSSVIATQQSALPRIFGFCVVHIPGEVSSYHTMRSVLLRPDFEVAAGCSRLCASFTLEKCSWAFGLVS